MEQTSPTSLVHRAAKLFQAGLFQPALDIIELEFNNSPDQEDLLILSATILHAQANWSAALVAIETASTLVPLPLSGQLVLADCFSHTGKHELALVAYQHLLSKESLPLDYYAALYAGFDRAGKTELALATCRKAIELSPDSDEAYFGMAHSMSKLAYSPRQITSVLRKAVALAPDEPNYRISLVVQLLLTKRRGEAHKILTAGSDALLNNLQCPCIARQVLDLCIWAGDVERCSLLGGVLAKMSHSMRQATVDERYEP